MNPYDIIEKYINTYGLIRHQFDTFHDFLLHGIQTVINDEPNIYTSDNKDVVFSNIRFKTPRTMSNANSDILLTPSMAREQSINYDFDVIADVDFENTKHTIVLFSMPAMVGSMVCNLYGKTDSEKIKLGELAGDKGGYFIINGKERIITGQIRKTYNRFICYKNTDDDYICEMRSMCEETSKSSLIQIKFNKKSEIVIIIDKKATLTAKTVFNKLNLLDKLENLIGDDSFELIETIHNIRNSGETVQSDINNCIKRMKKQNKIELILTLVPESDRAVLEKYKVEKLDSIILNCQNYNEEENFTESTKIDYDLTQFMPHLGFGCSNTNKGVLLGKMIRKLVLCNAGILKEEDKADLAYKRVDMVGMLCQDLFKMLWKQFIKSLTKEIEKRKIGSILPIIETKKNNIKTNFQFCFSTGTWGIKKNNYKKLGVSEFPQNKVSMLTNLALLRKINIPVGKKDKNIKLRQMHPSSIFYICPFETPEGASVGTRLTLSLLSFVSTSMSVVNLKEILLNSIKCDTDTGDYTILVNGSVFCYSDDPEYYIREFKKIREQSMVKFDVSITKIDTMKCIEIWCDSGRFMRAILNSSELKNYNEKYSIDILENKNILLYRDPMELECEYVSMDLDPTSTYTEIHPSCMMGLVACQIVFSNHTQSPRMCYMSNMIKQAIGILPTLENRTDSTVYNLDYVQKPLNTTKIANIVETNEFPNGINAVVAIACYTGFNQEDSIILNKSSLERGLFDMTVKRTISTEIKINNSNSYSEMICIPPDSLKQSMNLSKLNPETGVIKIGENVKKGDVVIGKISIVNKKPHENKSIVVKNNEEGKVENVFISNSIVKITIVQRKFPEIGDKFCSGMAQKGTCGMILPDVDMPFTKDGIIPDIIINPHCIPSRMTINQLMSSICSKSYCITGNSKFSDGSPFQTNNIVDEASNELLKNGFSYNGTEIMMNGMTGETIKSRIFIGPVYYHRLTHLVSNKIFSSVNMNTKNKLTRQPLNGRSNDGGLRIGEMEKDCLLRHGIIKFVNERMMDMSDKYHLKTCNTCKGYYHVTKLKLENKTTYICSKCKGVDISTTVLPYAAKLLVQELESMGLNVNMIAK